MGQPATPGTPDPRQTATTWARRLLSGELSVDQFAELVADTFPPPAGGPTSGQTASQTASQTGDRTADVGSARLDLDRQRRCGFPEVVYGPGKTLADLVTIIETLLVNSTEVLATRITPEQANTLTERFPTAVYSPRGRTLRVPLAGKKLDENPHSRGRVSVVTAGTGDLPVAEEAQQTALWMGCAVELVTDVGVAGPHRLPEQLPKLQNADAVVVVAGMEGALPSVVGGYLDCPIIAVPTSVGYGANLGGLAALLSMLNSCAANVTVVNIDAGFKGGYLAGLIATRLEAARGGHSFLLAKSRPASTTAGEQGSEFSL